MGTYSDLYRKALAERKVAESQPKKVKTAPKKSTAKKAVKQEEE